MSRVFFTDRDLGKQFPAILREHGIEVERHADHFAPNAADDDWLKSVGNLGWVVLTHDARIRYKVNERRAVMENGIAMFVLVGAAPYPDLARSFVALLPKVETFLDRNVPPFIARVYRPSPGDVRRNPRANGRVELWIKA